jgi:hypothetical protein
MSIRSPAYLSDLPLSQQASRISRHGRTSANIARHDTACADDRIVADGDAGQDQRTTAYPDIASDDDRPTELKHPVTLDRIARMIGR